MLSQRARYALKALTYVARVEEARPVQTGSIAEAEHIPKKFLEAILADLKRARLIDSVRGKFGGYRLARPADDITFGDVIRATDGPLALVPCVSKQFYRPCEDCPDEKACAIRRILADVRDEVSRILDGMSLLEAARIADQLADAGHSDKADAHGPA